VAKKTETTRKGREQEAAPMIGIGGEIYIATLNWPSLGITPDKLEYGLRSAAGPLAFSQDRAALVEWAKRNHICVRDDNGDSEMEED